MLLELPQKGLEASQAPRHSPMRPPPDEPLERVVDTCGTDFLTEAVPVHDLTGRRLVLVDVRDQQCSPFLGAPPARADARDIERTRPQRRGFPIDHRDSGANPARPEHDVLAEELS